ncbi:MAG: hypothetical protein OXU79_05445 [Gemmatimonadota bacterium]|nr:hypothetical protein [Gemmatimonadota bacterium]
MYKDIISYKLAESVSEEHLLAVARDVLNNWMSRQPGFKKWEIHRNRAGGYTDVVYWESEGDANKAQADMVNIPNAEDWYACYEEGSISSMNLDHVATLG